MNKLNSKKNINQAMENVKNAMQNNKSVKTNTKRKRKININNKDEDILLLTEIYEKPANSYETLMFKNKIKNLIKNDIHEWLNNNFSLIAKNYTKETFKSLNIKK